MLEAVGAGEGRVPGGDGCCRAEAGERGEHRRHRILAGRPQRCFMPRDPTRLIPATRNGGEGRRRRDDHPRLPRSAHAQDHAFASIDLAPRRGRATKAKDLGTGSGEVAGR